jgi:murein DD-endopeptidase MepM/ murein hydrolase activator NlpD
VSSGRLIAAAAAATALLVGGPLASVLLLADAENAAASSCGPSGPALAVDLDGLPPGPVAGYTGPQLANAALIMDAARQQGLDVRAQTLGVMTAMGESSLTVLDRGDAAGPDSRGLFQQRDNGAWGSDEDRMNPTVSASNFFRALAGVAGWSTLPPTIAAHRVQRNADPFFYEPYWDGAVQVVQALAGTSPTGATVVGLAAGTGGLSCTGTTPAAITADGWTKPALGPVTSHYDMRVHPVTGALRLHAGADVGASCDSPVYAAAGGIVVKAGPAGGYGTLITLDHGGGLTSRYAHMYPNGLLVQVGHSVAAGQQIARIGSYGLSTGCHLHFEIRIGDDFTDPAAFMTARGSPLG